MNATAQACALKKASPRKSASSKSRKDAEAPLRAALRPEFADVERYHLKPGLFQISQGGRKTDRLELRYKLSESGFLTVTGPGPLTPFDARLMCAILCMAGQNKITISEGTEDEIGKKLRTDLELMRDAAYEDCMAVKTTLNELIRSMGLSWHGSVSCGQIRNSIRRMYCVSFILDIGKKTYMHRLMSHVEIDRAGGTLVIGLNPILAKALMGEGHFARIDMEVLRRLKCNESLLYIMLSNHVDPGQSKRFTKDEIRGLLYGGIPDGMARSTLSQQKGRAMAALRELVGKLDGWEMEEAKDGVLIRRPPLQAPSGAGKENGGKRR